MAGWRTAKEVKSWYCLVRDLREGMNSLTDLEPPSVPVSTGTEGSGSPKPVPTHSGPPGAVATHGACPACGHELSRTLVTVADGMRTTAQPLYVVECVGCRLLRLSPWPNANAIRRHYPPGYWLTGGEAHSRIEEYWRRFLLRDHVQFVKSALRRADVAGPVLEVASRGGWFLQQIASRNRPVVAMDFDISAASASWHSKRLPALCGTLARAPFAPKSFAAIVMFQVLEHLFDPASHLEAARELLRPGGRLILQVPNASCWQFLLLGERWSGLDAPRHLIHYRAHDLEILLDRCGFEVERTKYFALRDNPSGLSSSLVPSCDPETRRLSGKPESARMRVVKDLIHQSLTIASLPFTIVEAACHAGSTVMIEARVKGA